MKTSWSLQSPPSQSLDIVGLCVPFLEVVDSGGFALAADNSRSPPAVSGHIGAWNRQPASACSAASTRRLELTQGGRDALRLCPQHQVELERESGARLHGTLIRDRSVSALRRRTSPAPGCPRVLHASPLAPRSIHRTQVGIIPTCSLKQAQGRTDVNYFGSSSWRVGDDGCTGRNRWSWAAATAIELPAGEPLPLALFPEPASTAKRGLHPRRRCASLAPGVRECQHGWLPVRRAGRFRRDGGGAQPDARGATRTGPGTGFPTLPEARFYAFALTQPGGRCTDRGGAAVWPAQSLRYRTGMSANGIHLRAGG